MIIDSAESVDSLADLGNRHADKSKWILFTSFAFCRAKMSDIHFFCVFYFFRSSSLAFSIFCCCFSDDCFKLGNKNRKIIQTIYLNA